MKAILLYILVALSLNATSQNYLTNRQVYDFDIGDILQTKYTTDYMVHPDPPPIYTTKTIINKVINGDSITYLINNNDYQPPACATCSPTINVYTTTQIVTDLDSAVFHYNLTTCFSRSDTMFYNACNAKVWQSFPVFDTACFEPTTETKQFVTGAGGPYFNLTLGNSPMGVVNTQYELTYYQKGNTTCGTFNTVGINQVKNASPVINVYPNPSSGQIKIESEENFVSFKAYDIIGKVCQNGVVTNNIIDISKLIEGTYFIAVYTSRNDMKVIRVEKE